MPNQHTAQDFLWIVIGDIHEDTDRFAQIPELSNANGIIVSGDMTNCGGAKEAEQVLKPLQSYNKRTFAQIGNMDLAEVTPWLMEKQLNLHTEVYEIAENIAIFGVGASTITPFNTPSEFPEEQFAKWLDECWQKAQTFQKTVLISHNPPKDTLCDDIGGGIHVGSTAVREFIEKNQPDICICGHIHEARQVDKIGRTTIINPGNFSEGGYVLLCCKDGELSAELKVLSKR